MHCAQNISPWLAGPNTAKPHSTHNLTMGEVTTKILCSWYASDDEKRAIKSMLPDGADVIAPVGEYLSRFDCALDDVKHLAPDVDGILGLSLPDGLLKLAEKLKIFSWMHSGVDDLVTSVAVDLFRDRGVKACKYQWL